MALLGFSLAYAGLLSLCLAMDRHHREVFGQRPPPRQRRRLRLCGWGLLGLSTLPCLAAWGAAIGPVGWFGLLTAAALTLVFLLPYAPRLATLPPAAALLAWLGLRPL